MTKIQRKTIRKKIIAAITEMTADSSNKESVVIIGSHKIERRLLYAGGSQWCGCGRDWDSTESGWAWVVDGQYRLTMPDLFGFDGHNLIEVQTGYYLLDGYDEQSQPEGPDGDPLHQVPNAVLIDIGRGLVEAKAAAAAAAQAEQTAAENLIAAL